MTPWNPHTGQVSTSYHTRPCNRHTCMQQVCSPAHCTVHKVYGQHPPTFQAGGSKPLLTHPPKHEFRRAWLAALYGQHASMLCGQARGQDHDISCHATLAPSGYQRVPASTSTVLHSRCCACSQCVGMVAAAHTNAAVPPDVMRLRPRV